MEESTGNGNRRREVTISWGPVKLTLRGFDVVLVFLLIFVGGGAVFMWHHDEATAATSKTIYEKVVKQEELLSEMIFILTLDEKQRKDLQMEMPESLRKKIRGR